MPSGWTLSTGQTVIKLWHVLTEGDNLTMHGISLVDRLVWDGNWVA